MEAEYFVRVVGTNARPIIQIFSTALADVEASPELLAEVNDINTRLHLCRCFWVLDQVLFETEHLGMTITPDDFRALVGDVAEASDFFGPPLHQQFGGRLAFAESKGPAAEDSASYGLYL